jgi:hypothetical protein
MAEHSAPNGAHWQYCASTQKPLTAFEKTWQQPVKQSLFFAHDGRHPLKSTLLVPVTH